MCMSESKYVREVVLIGKDNWDLGEKGRDRYRRRREERRSVYEEETLVGCRRLCERWEGKKWKNFFFNVRLKTHRQASLFVSWELLLIRQWSLARPGEKSKASEEKSWALTMTRENTHERGKNYDLSFTVWWNCKIFIKSCNWEKLRARRRNDININNLKYARDCDWIEN